MIHLEVIGLGLSGLSANDADSVGVGVSHINGTLRVYKDAVQAVHSAAMRVVAFRAITFFSITSEEFQPASFSVDHPHAMTLGIG